MMHKCISSQVAGGKVFGRIAEINNLARTPKRPRKQVSDLLCVVSGTKDNLFADHTSDHSSLGIGRIVWFSVHAKLHANSYFILSSNRLQ